MSDDPIANLLALTDCNWAYDTQHNDSLGSYSSDLFAVSGPDLAFDEQAGVPSACPSFSDHKVLHTDAPSTSRQSLIHTQTWGSTPADSAQAAAVSSLTALDCDQLLHAAPADSTHALTVDSLTEHLLPDDTSRQQPPLRSRYDDESKLQVHRLCMSWQQVGTPNDCPL